MKRWIAVLLLLALMLTLCACKKDKAETPEKSEYTFLVVHKDGTEKNVVLSCTGKTLAEDLLAEKLIEESAESAGFYDVVDGEKADWNDGEAWWCFYCNDKALTVGVGDVTPKEGDVFKAVFTNGMN